MDPLYNVNGLMFWSEREIRLRQQFSDHFTYSMEQILLETNPAWRMIQIEAPLLTPANQINPNYTPEDVWFQGIEEDESQGACNACGELIPKDDVNRLVLRPETTPGSYMYAKHLLETHSGIKPPFCVWQVGKSFRREQDQVTKNMRLKEFYQQEFQCIYAADTMNDYHQSALEPVRRMISEIVGVPTRLVESDRLPSYSEVTMDVEAWITEIPDDHVPVFTETLVDPKPRYVGLDALGRWMEVCSISRRTDFPAKAKFQTKKKLVEKDLLVLEVAIGLDRCVFNFEQKEV